MNILIEAAECVGDDVGAQHQQRDEKYPPEQLLRQFLPNSLTKYHSDDCRA